MALSFNVNRDGLLLDHSKVELEDEPRYFFTAAAYGQDASWYQESYTGPQTSVALVQGRSYRDVDRTLLINRNISAAEIAGEQVDVATLHGRVTLRGSVNTAVDRMHIANIAVAASRVELVDNQITLKPPVMKN
jgi:hypothetical protein